MKIARCIRPVHCLWRNLHQFANPDAGDLSRIRTIGVIAHVDAGKTTTTERMLYYSGMSTSIGEVHRGDTVTDYLPQERERGITITSAAISFQWKKHTVNLLDTPGHVDFTVEVERCLSAMDGAVVILDSSAGVEAQTSTVWRQADKFDVCKLVYLNKMDKQAANISMCLQSLKKIGSNPVLVHVPIYKDGVFTGAVDVVEMHKYVWEKADDGKQFLKSSLEVVDDSKLFETSCKARENVIESLCDIDDHFADAVIACDKYANVSSSLILNAIRRATIQNKAQAVLCGSSYKNVAVQLLMDSILKYLPSPFEKEIDILKYYGTNLCVLVFKIIHHNILGALTFARIYSGKLTPLSRVYNINRECFEKVHKLYIPFADEFKEVSCITAGHIVAISGFKVSVTGDTLTSSAEVVTKAKETYCRDKSIPLENCQPVLAGIEAPVPVYFCSIEAPSLSKQKELERALECLQREDPSLVVSTHGEQTIVSGMGELHIQILKDRLLKEYKVDAYLGPLQIAYLESIEGFSEERITVDKTIGGVKNLIDIFIRVRKQTGPSSKKLKIVRNENHEIIQIRPDRYKAVENGVSLALSNGPVLGFPVADTVVELIDLKTNPKATNAMVAAAMSQCVTAALRKCSPFLLEPLMAVEITLPDEYMKHGLICLSTRRSLIQETESKQEMSIIRALMPLSEMSDLSSEIRTLTSGTAILSMKLSQYQKMNEFDQKRAVESIVGFI